MAESLAFVDLNLGDTFDFIAPDGAPNSWFFRAIKTSERTYRALDSEENKRLGAIKIGSINARVYHVERAPFKVEPVSSAIHLDSRLPSLISQANDECASFVKFNPTRSPVIRIYRKRGTLEARCVYFSTQGTSTISVIWKD
jgi:hypothetical protein